MGFVVFEIDPSNFTEEQVNLLKERVSEKRILKTPKKSKAGVRVRETSVKQNDVELGDIDIFDFDTYSTDYKLIKSVFTKANNLELCLRSALLIDYKYNYLSEESRDAFVKMMKEKKSKAGIDGLREYLESVLDVLDPLYIITCFYRHFAPNKPKEEVEKLHEKYSSISHVTMFNCAYRKYVDQNWKNKELWFE